METNLLQHPSGSSSSNQALADRIFGARGELAGLCRAKDWSETGLGAIESWPASLRAVAGLVVAAPAPMIVLWGADLIQIYNDGYRGVMGAKHPAGLGQATRECWPEVWEFNAPLYEGVVQRRESFAFDHQPLTVDRHGYSEEAFFTLTYSPVLDDKGEVGGVLVTVTETTSERARNESEERLNIALEAADLGAWDLDLTTDRASTRTLRHDQIFGYQELQSDWGAQIAMRHMLPEDRPIAERAFARAPETGVLGFEARVHWPDNSIRWISVLGRTYYDSKGRPIRMAGVVADVTDRNRMEALRQSEERFRLLADALPQIIWMTDAQGRTELCNKQWFAYTGQACEEPGAEHIAFARLHADDAARTRARFAQANETGSGFSVEHRIRSASGKFRWFVSMVEPYNDAATGEISRWIGISIDIHDRKLAEEKLRQVAELDAFRVALDNALRPLADPVEVQKAAGLLLGQQLDASRVMYGEVSADGDHVLVQGTYCNGVACADGRYRFEDFGPTLVADHHAECGQSSDVRGCTGRRSANAADSGAYEQPSNSR